MNMILATFLETRNQVQLNHTSDKKILNSNNQECKKAWERLRERGGEDGGGGGANRQRQIERCD